MHFVAIGLNVGNAPLELREQLSFTGESLTRGSPRSAR